MFVFWLWLVGSKFSFRGCGKFEVHFKKLPKKFFFAVFSPFGKKAKDPNSNSNRKKVLKIGTSTKQTIFLLPVHHNKHRLLMLNTSAFTADVVCRNVKRMRES